MSTTTTEYPGWTFAPDGDSWRGTHEDGRRTALKGSLTHARGAVDKALYVCPEWPWCEHQTDEVCSREWARARAARRAGRPAAPLARRPGR